MRMQRSTKQLPKRSTRILPIRLQRRRTRTDGARPPDPVPVPVPFPVPVPVPVLSRGAVVLGLVVCLALISGCQILNRSSAVQGIQGRIVWPKDGDLWVYDVSSKQQ